jgi:agmatine deiminase
MNATGTAAAQQSERVRMPGEWEPHERTLMAWPCRLELWGQTLARARADYAAVANAIAAFEPVTMIAGSAADAVDARAACGSGVEIEELPLDDSWMRDCGPIYVLDERRGARVAMHFRFNAWGEKFDGWERDAAVGALIARRLGGEVREVAMVLEGGSILSDGAGSLLSTEQCLLNPNRNPSFSRERIEATLGDALGARRVVWLGRGLVEDRDTDGHVDLIAAIAPGGRVLVQTVQEGNPNFEHCAENAARLAAAGIEAVPMPHLPYAQVAGKTVAVSYLNLYICNRAVIVATCGADSDPNALAIIAGAFPAREVVTVPGEVLAYGGGGPHCITQQVPSAR